MNKIEKIQIAIDVALYYFTIDILFYILSINFPCLLFRSSNEFMVNLRSYAPSYVPLIVPIMFLAILSNLLKRKVQVSICIDSKPLIFIIVGVLLIITGVTTIPMYVSVIGVLLEHSSLSDVYESVVKIVIYVVQIGIGTCITFMSIKRDKQIEKIKIAVDIALCYFIIKTVLNLLSTILADLFSKNSKGLFSGLSINALMYVVLVVVILFLAILSNVLKRKSQECISIDIKQLIYIIVGILLIITGVRYIPSQVSIIYHYYNWLIDINTSPVQRPQYINRIYWSIVRIIFYTFEIGIGAYFTFIVLKRDKPIEKIH